jgi:hypothetical protein
MSSERQAAAGAPGPVPTEQARLEQMSSRALIGQLAVLNERLTSETTAGGYRPLPGRSMRIASLTRRIRLTEAELARRTPTPGSMNQHSSATPHCPAGSTSTITTEPTPQSEASDP